MVKATLYKGNDTLVMAGSFDEAQKLEWVSFLKSSGLGACIKSKQAELGKMQYNLFPGKGAVIASRNDIPSFLKIVGNNEAAEKNKASANRLNYRSSLCPDCGREMENDGGSPYCEFCEG